MSSDDERDLDQISNCSSNDSLFLRLQGTIPNVNMNMTPELFGAAIESAIQNALRMQADAFQAKIDDLAGQISSAHITAPKVQVYEDVTISENITCNEPLDAVKCLPEFSGSQETYVSWRQAARAAYKIYETYKGSSRHYQAVLIIRSKVRGVADAALASFNTPLNFEAIINRLDFTYSDKRPIHVIEQELGTLRQGNLTLLQYYDEVEKKLTLLTNKVNMTYDATLAQGMCEKFRGDAMRVFISGLKRNLTDVLFAAKPSNLPTALALAQEIEANHDRYAFASSYARGQEEKAYKQEQRFNGEQKNSQKQGGRSQPKSPHYKQQQGNRAVEQDRNRPGRDSPEPMDIDSSSKFRQPTAHQKPSGSGRSNHAQAFKRPASERTSGQRRRQRVDHIDAETAQAQAAYAKVSAEAVAQLESEAESDDDNLNFLGQGPCCHSFGAQ